MLQLLLLAGGSSLLSGGCSLFGGRGGLLNSGSGLFGGRGSLLNNGSGLFGSGRSLLNSGSGLFGRSNNSGLFFLFAGEHAGSKYGHKGKSNDLLHVVFPQINKL
ncbi:hypothetical protein ACUUL3_15480 [Thiovibrio sp. JS02]